MKKRLNKGLLLIMATLLVAMPLGRSSASVFNEQSVVNLINKDRVERKIEPLVMNKQLSRAAEQKAQDMIANNYFAHTSPQGVTPWQWIEKNGYDYSVAGENLAINFADAESQHEALMKSESHRKNILNDKYKEIGVAVVSGMINGKQSIITVQEFGTKSVAMGFKKDVAGAESAKQIQVVNVANQPVLQNEISSMGTEKLTTIVSEKVFPVVGAALLLISSVLLLLLVFVSEVAHDGLNFLNGVIFPKRRNNDVLFPENIDNELDARKSYLTHMKLRN